jgi:hypothetical protein
MSVQQSAEYIANNADFVSINIQELPNIAQKIVHRMESLAYDTKQWKQHPLHPKITTTTINHIFLIDLLNYSFWGEKSNRKRFTVTLDGQSYTGYWSLCAVINRCIKEGIDIINPKFYAHASVHELQTALRPDSDEHDPMPLLQTRINMLYRAGTILLQVHLFNTEIQW